MTVASCPDRAPSDPRRADDQRGKRVTVELPGTAAVLPSSLVDDQDRPWLSLLSALDGDQVVERRVEDRMITELPSYRWTDLSCGGSGQTR